MTKTEAAKILEQLLNGLDPVTGETLPDDHTCAQTSVMRALHMGYAALMQAEVRIVDRQEECRPASRENTHKNWSDEEDQYLAESWTAGVPLDEMRRHLRRSLRSVKCRLVYRGLADYDILERKYQPPKGCEHSGLPWYLEEEEAVAALFAGGVSLHEIGRCLKRTPRGVGLHLLHMGLVDQEQLDELLGLGQEGGTPS